MEPPSEHHIETAVNPSFPNVNESQLAAILSHVLKAERLPSGSASIAVVTDPEIRDLNHRFRGVSAATDVLTFVDGFSSHLADIAIAYPTAARQAEMRGVDVQQELAMLTIHAGLHIAGYDDETEADQRRMVARMNEIAAATGVATDAEWWSRHYAQQEAA
jgi:probable rRNA maturation factor